MAINGLTTLLIARLDHQDAIARLNLLKLIKVSCHYSCIQIQRYPLQTLQIIVLQKFGWYTVEMVR